MQKIILWLSLVASAVILSSCFSPRIIIADKNEVSSKQHTQRVVTDYWVATKNMELAVAANLATGKSQKQFVKALELVRSRNLDSAIVLLESLSLMDEDSILTANAAMISQNLLLTTAKWNKLTGSLASFGAAYAKSQAETVTFPAEAEVLPISFNLAKTPLVDVEINGIKREFLFDTGCGITVLSSDLAAECGIKANDDHTNQAVAATGQKVAVKPVVLNEMRIGKIGLKNHPAMILNSDQLKMKILGLTLLKIDGIIGWNAIKNFHAEIDYKGKKLVLSKPAVANNSPSNLFWLGKPLIQAATDDGSELFFGLDTGANHSCFTFNYLDKVQQSLRDTTSSISWSAGGTVQKKGIKIPTAQIVVDDRLLICSNLKAGEDAAKYFVNTDGTLGNDIGADKITIDFVNGIFEIKR